MLTWFERYEQQGRAITLPDFLKWTLAQLGTVDALEDAPYTGQTEKAGPPIPVESLVFQHMIQLYRRLKQETKAASRELPINHLDEFIMLMIVMDTPGVRKNDMVTMNRLEVSSGNEMINRLIRGGWLREEAQGRYRLLYVTEAGQKLAYDLIGRYNAVAAAIAGPLSIDQRLQLKELLHLMNSDYN